MVSCSTKDICTFVYPVSSCSLTIMVAREHGIGHVFTVGSCLLTIMVAEGMRSDMLSTGTTCPRGFMLRNMFELVWYIVQLRTMFNKYRVHCTRVRLVRKLCDEQSFEISLWVITLREYEGVILSTCW
jgi:hypothetical protein